MHKHSINTMVIKHTVYIHTYVISRKKFYKNIIVHLYEVVCNKQIHMKPVSKQPLREMSTKWAWHARMAVQSRHMSLPDAELVTIAWGSWEKERERRGESTYNRSRYTLYKPPLQPSTMPTLEWTYSLRFSDWFHMHLCRFPPGFLKKEREKERKRENEKGSKRKIW